MEYEHEKKIRRWVELELFRYGHHFREYDAEVIKELEEVYAKAREFDKIRNVDKDFYKEYGYYPNEEEWWYDASNIIEKYEELHGGQIK